MTGSSKAHEVKATGLAWLAQRVSVRQLAILVLLSAVVTAGLIVYGSWVRVSASGLGCPNWPLCNGVSLPGNKFAAIESGHRVLASLTATMVCASGVFAFFKRKSIPGPARLLIAAALLILSQAVLGGIVVLTDLQGFTRLAHLALAMTILGLLVMAGFALLQNPIRTSIAPLRPGHLMLLGAAVILLGGSMVATSTGSLCPGLPFCSSESPAMATALHDIHRTLAILFAIGVLGQGALLRKRGASRATWFAFAATVVFLTAQIIVGIATVAEDLPDQLRILHVGMGTMTWASLISLWALSSFTTPKQSEK